MTNDSNNPRIVENKTTNLTFSIYNSIARFISNVIAITNTEIRSILNNMNWCVEVNIFCRQNRHYILNIIK